MNRPTPTQRRRLVALAGHRGDTTTIRAHLDDPDAKVRGSALHALHRAGDLDSTDLTAALQDRDPGVRVTALELAAGTDQPPIASLLDDPDPRVVETAAWAAGERPPDPAVIARLATLASTHEDPLCRESAIAALGALGDPGGLDAVLAGLEDKPAVRRRAVVALAAFEGEAVDAALERARDDRDRQVRDAVDELLGPR